MRTNKLVFKQQIHGGAINAVKVNDHGQSKRIVLEWGSDILE